MISFVQPGLCHPVRSGGPAVRKAYPHLPELSVDTVQFGSSTPRPKTPFDPDLLHQWLPELDADRVQKIKAMVAEWESLIGDCPPERVRELKRPLRKMGIFMRRYRFYHGDAGAATDLKLFFDKPYSYIRLKKKDTPEKQAICLAHELSHALFHKNNLFTGDISFRAKSV